MSNCLTNTAEPCTGGLPADAPELPPPAISKRPAIRLPPPTRRLVGPWCFLDAYGPLAFSSGKPMDVAPHPHIGLQTVSWLLEGEVMHHDSLGLEGTATPGVLNLMTAGRGIAHAEETPAANAGRLRGVQLWVALPEASRETAPAFESHRSLPVVELEGGQATVIMVSLAACSAPAFSRSSAWTALAPGGRSSSRSKQPEHASCQGRARRPACRRHAVYFPAGRESRPADRELPAISSAAPSARRS
jgi:redox-sensitive bicupin YhaK (pirin superfamily)